MTAPNEPDPVAAYITALDASLHGPRRAKDRLLTEIAEGLRDAAEPYRTDDADLTAAVHRAADDFGHPHDLVAECQHELTIRQTRTTAARLALCAAAALVCWHFLWIGADAGTWRLVALPLAAVTMVGALHATGVLLVTGRLGRRLRGPTSLPTVTARAASATAVAMVLTTVVLVAALAGATTVVPVALAAGTAVVGHAVVAASARRCRRCGRLGRP